MEGYHYILYQSLEIEVQPPTYRALCKAFDPGNDLVVGAGALGSCVRLA